MSEQTVMVCKDEMPWISWKLMCVKFSFDPFKTKDILLYVRDAHPVKERTE